MENIKKTQVKYPYLEKPLSVYTFENGHKVVFAYKKKRKNRFFFDEEVNCEDYYVRCTWCRKRYSSCIN